MAKKKKRTRRSAAPERIAPRTLYVIVHRNSTGEIMEAGEPFHDEHQSLHALMVLSASINFFPGDSLHMEEEGGQSEEALNK